MASIPLSIDSVDLFGPAICFCVALFGGTQRDTTAVGASWLRRMLRRFGLNREPCPRGAIRARD